MSQDTPGIHATLSFSQKLSLSDNPNLASPPKGNTATSDTGLKFQLESETLTQVFRFTADARILGDIYSKGTKDNFNVKNHGVSVFYSQEGANTDLSFSAFYSSAYLENLTYSPIFDPDLVIIDNGSRQRIGFSSTIKTGTQSPFGVDLTVGGSKTRYSGTSDPNLVDQRSLSADAVAHLRLSESLTLRGLAGVSRKKYSDLSNTERNSRYIGAGVSGSAAGGLSFRTDITFDRTENMPGTTYSGAGLSASVSKEIPGGTLGFDVSSRIGETGRASRATVSRSVELAAGTFDLSLGAADLQGSSGIQPEGSVRYTQQTERGDFSARLSRGAAARDGLNYANTQIAVDYTQAISETAHWNAGVSYAATSQVGGTDSGSRATASVGYTQALNADWDFHTGLSHSWRTASSSPNRNANTLFFSVERDIAFGF